MNFETEAIRIFSSNPTAWGSNVYSCFMPHGKCVLKFKWDIVPFLQQWAGRAGMHSLQNIKGTLPYILFPLGLKYYCKYNERKNPSLVWPITNIYDNLRWEKEKGFTLHLNCCMLSFYISLAAKVEYHNIWDCFKWKQRNLHLLFTGFSELSWNIIFYHC